MAKNPAAPNERKRSRIGIPMLLVLSLIGTVTMQHAFVFLLAGMLPSIVAGLVDTSRGRHIFASVGAMNFAGVFPPLFDILMQPNVANATVEKISDPAVWFIMYLAAAMGWVLIWLCPLVCQFILHTVYKGQIIRLEMQQKRLIDEWGPEVKRRE